MTRQVANPKITQLVMYEYEKLRKANVNMLDTNMVYQKASSLGMQELAKLIEEDLHSYLEIIRRHRFYSKRYYKR